MSAWFSVLAFGKVDLQMYRSASAGSDFVFVFVSCVSSEHLWTS